MSDGLTGWKKGAVIGGSAMVGLIAGNRAVSLQYDIENFYAFTPFEHLAPRLPELVIDFEFLEKYGWLYLGVGAGIGSICGAFFAQNQRSTRVWWGSWIFTLVAAWFAPALAPTGSPMTYSTLVAWVATAAFCLFHFACLRISKRVQES
ncbi:MAG: hypothetical protein ABL962_01465 [Fimbriimonadaceae bacterium]